MKLKLFNWLKAKEVPLAKKTEEPDEVPKGIKGGRQSEPDTVGLFSAIADAMAEITPDFELELINYVEHLAKYNGDVSYAVDNIVQLGNTPYTIHFGDEVTEEQAREMSVAVKANTDAIYSGGLNSLINDLLAQTAITGALSSELAPTEALDDIKKAIIVPTSTIRFFYDEKLEDYLPYQKVSKSHLRSIQMGKASVVKLNPVTYKYYAIRRFNGKPYGIPPFLSALDSISIEKSMICSLKDVVKKLGIFGFMSILVTPPQRNLAQNESEDAYAKRCLAYLESIRPEAEKGFSSGLAIGFKGTHEFSMENTDINIQGAKELFNLVSEFKMSGLKQDPLMLGRNFNVAETMARVILAKLSTQIKNYQALLASFLADFVKLRLSFLGYGWISSVTVEFEPAMVTDKSKEEDAYGKKIANYNDLYNQGIINQQQRAQALGYDEPDQEEPRNSGPIDPNAPIDEEEDAAVEDTTATESNNRIVALTKKQANLLGTLSGVPVGFAYAHVTLTNGEVLPNLLIKDRTKLYIPSDEIEFSALDIESIEMETLDTLSSSLRADVTPFDYEPLCSDDGCSHERHRNASFARSAEDLFEHLNGYINATIGQYNKATKKVIVKIAKSLAEFGQGASLEQVQDKVLYTLYKNWPADFSAGQKRVINKWINIAYKSYRNDASVLTGNEPAPKATFGLRDIRTMEYFKNSDGLYLGKFITDPDLKKKVTEFIKQKYLDEALPIGKNKQVLDSFRSEFAELMGLQDWKIVSILSTTINKMRNSAALNYMEQAGVERFEVRGITDRLQCEYCKSMQGRVFEVSKAIGKLDALVTSDPAYVKVVTPFITDVYKGKEGRETLAGLSDEAIQASGIDLPSYHPNCRDRIVAIV